MVNSTVQSITAIAALIAGLSGLAAVGKVLLDLRNGRKTQENDKHARVIDAEELELRRDIAVLDEYRRLLATQRETLDDYQEATNVRFVQLAQDMAELRATNEEYRSKIQEYRIDRDTLIQHIVEGRGLPLPPLRTI